MNTNPTGAIVLLSGGQDSTTCLAWTIAQHFNPVYTLSFDYGQRHRVELERSAHISNLLGAVHNVLPIKALSILAGGALTNKDIDVEATASDTSANQYAALHGLPSTFIPGRNMIFLALAAAYGANLGVVNIVTGVCEQDRSGYPDCREEFIISAAVALTDALDTLITIHAPLLSRSKAETWELAEELGILDVIVNETHTCYHGDRSVKHDWGYGCNDCPACDERKRGWNEFKNIEVNA